MRWVWLLLLLLWVGWPQPAAARPPQVDGIVDAAEDEPRNALNQANLQLLRARQAGDLALQAWIWLARAEVHLVTEQPQEAASDLRQASALIARLPAPPDEVLVLTQALVDLAAQRHALSSAETTGRLAALRPRIQAQGDARLLCDLTMAEVEERRRAGDIDGAWLAAEAYARCARRSGNVYSIANALTGLSVLRDLMATDVDGVQTSLGYAREALAVLEGHPARFRRSIIEWEIGTTLIERGDGDGAIAPLTRALTLARELGDAPGIAIATTDLARAELAAGRPDAALARLKGQALPADLPAAWRASALRVRLRAQAQLGHPEVLMDLGAAQALLPELPNDATRASLLAAVAEAWASQQRHREAHAALQEADQLLSTARELVRDQDVLRLQSRYETTLRQAEAQALRATAEQAQLAMAAAAARRESLWALIAALAVAGVVSGFGVWTYWRKRRIAAHLALRDALTAAPNRRAVSTYAQAQFTLAQRVGAPLTLAVVDLDHFKRVNDTWGHDGGDAVLRAFASSARSVLRGQDMLGRWGGEEWLLVLPGTREEEIGFVFQRLRASFAATTIPGLSVPHGLSFSMGAAMVTSAHRQWMEAVNWADQALYRAKESGRDRVCCAGLDEEVIP